MYGIALSVAACLRAGTRVDVAWNLDPAVTPEFDPTDAVAITPGGGRLGGLLGGALDSRLIEEAAVGASHARILTIDLPPLEASLIGVEAGTSLRVALAPAESLPAELWQQLLERSPAALALRVEDSIVANAELVPFDPAADVVAATEDRISINWRPTTTLVVMGGGPMADAVAQAGAFVGWNVERPPGTEATVALATSLSSIDGIVVMGHDTEAVGRVLQTALSSHAGYIGSIGPRALQEARSDWLAYRGVVDIDRVHGPAGIDIGASSPPEIAISVVAEMIAVAGRST